MTDAKPTAAELHEKMLRKKFWLVHSNPVGSRAEIEKLLPEHLLSQIRLEREGVLFGAGPVSDENGNPEYGMFILRCASREEANAIADADPLHKAGLRSYTLHQWSMNEGRVNISIDASDQTYRFA
jgi:hypothetical protein